MSEMKRSPGQDIRLELRFACLFRQGRGLSFPCDDKGRVDLRGLTEKARANYDRALANVGREFAHPVVEMC